MCSIPSRSLETDLSIQFERIFGPAAPVLGRLNQTLGHCSLTGHHGLMTMALRFTPRGLLPRGFLLHSLPLERRTDSEDVEYPSSSKNLWANHGSFLGGLWVPRRMGMGPGMTAQPNGMIMGGRLTEIARGNGTRNYVTERLPGPTNQHPSFVSPSPPLLQLHTGMVVIMAPLICLPLIWPRTCWKKAQKHHPDSTGQIPSVPCCKAREGQEDYRTDMLGD